MSTGPDPALVERACVIMHDAYEAAATEFGWETQVRTRVPWMDVPEENKATMRAAVTALLNWQTGRRAPVQGEHAVPRRAPGTVAWDEHVEAYTAYAARYGVSQTAERLAQRGGFGYIEMTNLLGHEPTTWRAHGA